MSTWRGRALLAALLSALALAASVAANPAGRALAACSGNVDDPPPIPVVVSPAATEFVVSGPAPLTLVLAIPDSWLPSIGPVVSTIRWGDGSSPSAITVVDCGDDDYSFPPQQLSHSYPAPGQYLVSWTVNFNTPEIPSLDVPIAMVDVQGASTPLPATSTPVPAPTPAGEAQPTATPVSAVTPVGQVTPPSPVSSPSGTAPPTAVPSGSPGTGTPATGAPTATATPTATPTPPPPAPTETAAPPPPETTPVELPQVVLDVVDVSDVSTDPAVAATNVVLAGVTVWVFFSSVLFNQTLQDNRGEVERWVRALLPASRRRRIAAPSGPAARMSVMAGVLIGTGLVYGFLEPSFGFNRPSLLLFTSVVIGLGLVGLLFAGVEAWIRRREPGVVSVVKPFPLVVLIGAGCVLVSRILDLHPGVVYGFAASCVVVGTTGVSRMEGRVQAVTISLCIVLSVACWLMLGPLRALPDGWPAQLLQSIAVIVFVGGMEGLLVNLVPLEAMDGAKIYRWSRLVWAALVLVSAFVVWHVLLNTQRSSFESLRPASSWSVVAGFALYTVAGMAFWAFFALKKRQSKSSPDSETA